MIVMASREVPILEAILPSYIVLRNASSYHESVLLLIFPHQSPRSLTVTGVKLVDRWS